MNTLNRRHFLQQAGAAAVGLPMLRFAAYRPTSALTENLGLQLYTVREQLQSDPMGTLTAIKEAGYRQVELMDASLLPKLFPVLQSMELAVNSTHVLGPYFTGNWKPMAAFGVEPPPKDTTFDTMLELAVKYKLRYLVFPFLFPEERGGLDDYKKLSEKLNEAGEKCQAAGISLCYHNHSFEFQPMDGSSPFKVLYQELDPKLVNFEIDVFWVSVAGLDPVAFIREHQARIKLLHLKDKKKGAPQTYRAMSMPHDSFQPVGAGVLDFKAILKAADEAGVAYSFVEQDQSANPLESIRQSIAYLKKLDV